MRRFIEGADRGQSTMLPECLDDWVEESNPVRAVDAFVDALRLFRIGYSWAGPVSLVVPYHVQGMRSHATPYRGVLVRFSIGFEAVADLMADLQQALVAAFGDA